MDPEGPSGSPVEWQPQRTVDLNGYRRPGEVIFIMDAELEDKNKRATGSRGNAHASLREARQNTEMGLNAVRNGTSSTLPGGADVMDMRAGNHLPQGKAPYNVDDSPGERRGGQKVHLNSSSNAMFLDGHADRVRPFTFANPIDNYEGWLRRMGIRDPQRVKNQTMLGL
jgi:prepilin-type processing-associated H-X9-DG protein